MSLTLTQMGTLRALADADPTAHDLELAGDDVALAAWFNVVDPAYWVWRTRVTAREVMSDAAFDWTRVDNLTVGKARIWDLMFKYGDIDASSGNVRAGIDAAWIGTAADLAVKASVYTKCKRNATRAEKALATGSGTNATPSVMGFEGMIDYGTASQIRS